MSVWVLVVAYLVIFVLLQFAIYRYVRRGDGSPPTWGRIPEAEVGSPRNVPVERDQPGDPTARGDRLDDAAHADVDGTARYCPACGARNASEPSFRFCRNCVGPLGR